MPIDSMLSLSAWQPFVFVLTRILGAFIFVPIPGVKSAPPLMASAITLAMYPAWPHMPESMNLAVMVRGILSEAAFGLGAGLVVAFVMDMFLIAAQLLSAQAGFSYASTIDPTTQADSNVLQVLCQLIAGMLFFATGLDRQTLLAFAKGLSSHPPGTILLQADWGQDLIRLGSGMFSTAFRMVLPVLALLLMVDLCMGLLGRLNAQLQLITLAFPVKTLGTLPLLAWSVLLFPRATAGFIENAFAVLRKITGSG
jgi:flagellar biosynthesis protein FliR